MTDQETADLLRRCRDRIKDMRTSLIAFGDRRYMDGIESQCNRAGWTLAAIDTALETLPPEKPLTPEQLDAARKVIAAVLDKRFGDGGDEAIADARAILDENDRLRAEVAGLRRVIDETPERHGIHPAGPAAPSEDLRFQLVDRLRNTSGWQFVDKLSSAEAVADAILPLIDRHIEQRTSHAAELWLNDLRKANQDWAMARQEVLVRARKAEAERDAYKAQLDAIRPRAQAIYDRWQYDDADIDARAILHIIDGPTPPAGTETTDG